jgi:hypothetical protein
MKVRPLLVHLPGSAVLCGTLRREIGESDVRAVAESDWIKLLLLRPRCAGHRLSTGESGFEGTITQSTASPPGPREVSIVGDRLAAYFFERQAIL